jgi:hypothetical protein
MGAYHVGLAAAALACGLAQAAAADLPVVAKAPPAIAAGEGGFWIGAEFLYWSTKGDRLPALVTSGATGVLGAPGTSILFGNATVGDDWRPGGRLRAGYWFDPARTMGIEGHFFGLADTSTDFQASSTGTTLLARPFLNASVNIPDTTFIAGGPGNSSGQVSVNETSRLVGAGLVFRGELCATCAFGSVSGLIGYRYLHLRDDLRISSASQGIFFGSPFTSAASDEFEAANNFHGLDLGLTGEIRSGPWSVEWLAKAALGVNVADVSINGASTATAFGATASSAGGLLAQPTNIGNFSNSHFAVVPELALKLGYQITPQWRAVVGYDALYWSDVQRAGSTIDTTVNPTQIGGLPLAGPARPAPQFATTSFWAQGVTVGATYRY